MAKQKEERLIVGLDIGTTKVVALVGEVTEAGEIQVIGIGSHPSYGLKRGMVVNIEATIQSIQEAIEAAEAMSNCEIHAVYVGISGSHIRSLNSHGIVGIRDKEVRTEDIERVLEAAKAVAIPADYQILHVLPKEFMIDGQEGIRDPHGMSGVRLESKVHIVTGSVSAAQNIVKCVERCGLTAADIILEQLASSLSVLSEDEKELGVCLIDIGGGTTDLAVFTQGAIQYTGVIPIAGNQVTNDIAISLGTPTKHAESLKIHHANAWLDASNREEKLEVPGMGDRPSRQVSKRLLTEVVAARYEELFDLVNKELKKNGFEQPLAAGIVLTGGGAMVQGVVQLAEQIFKTPVRIGLPQHISGLEEVVANPIYSTAVGLLLYAQQERTFGEDTSVSGHAVQKLWGRMRNWFQGNF